MAMASTIRDTMPTPWDGKNLWNGKKNPVTLVSTVVTRNSAVQPSSRFPPSSPNTTTNPEKIPIKLNTTCTNVNVVIPKIMIFPPSRRKNSDDPVEREDTTHFHRGAIFQGGPFPDVWAGSSPSRSPERRTPASRIAPHTLFHLSSFPSPLPHTRVCSNTDTLRDPAPCSR